MKKLVFLLVVSGIVQPLRAGSLTGTESDVNKVISESPRIDWGGPGRLVPDQSNQMLEGGPSTMSFELDAPAPVVVPGPQRANPAIDYETFAKNVHEVDKLREQRRVSESEFLKMAAEPGTVILDARSREKYSGLHIKGALNLPLPDFTAEELEKLIPEKATRILIYCNNNFDAKSSPAVATFAPTKAPPASLNIYTFNTLYSYGYRNVYELGPLIKLPESKLSFEGSSVPPSE